MKKNFKIIKNENPINVEKVEKPINDLELNSKEIIQITQPIQPTQSIQTTQPTQPIQPITEPEIKQPKPKQIKSEKQQASFLKARATKEENFRIRQELKRLQDLQIQKEFEDKVVKKAIAIKVKRSKKEKIIDNISDVDETELEQIKQKSKPKPKPKAEAIIPVQIEEPLFSFIKRK
jgi:hypothetical protein